MTHLLFVRHGEDEDNANMLLNGRRDKPLTERGRSQARRAARRLSILRPDIIYASPLVRASETGRIIADLIGIRRFETMPDLIERDFGILAGKTYEDIPNYATKWLQLPDYRYFISGEGVESFESVRDRVRSVRDLILSRHPTERVLVASHGDVYKMFLALSDDLEIEAALQTPFIENADIADFGIIS